jgi:hypothetical protein
MKSLTVMLCALLMSSPVLAEAPHACQASSGKFVTPLLELYTSEGCSSCPPADRWFSKQIKRSDVEANYLSFHVDYWDDIGWPDRFADHSYTQRQRARVQKNGSTTVYTPQLMIGEKTTVSWYKQEQSDSTIKQANKTLAPASIKLMAEGGGTEWRASVELSSTQTLPNAQWYFAMYQDGITSSVSAGENNGVVLKHDRVVRQWLGPFLPDPKVIGSRKSFNLSLPKNASAGQVGLLAVLEDSVSGKVLQSLKLPLSQCVSVANR